LTIAGRTVTVIQFAGNGNGAPPAPGNLRVTQQ